MKWTYNGSEDFEVPEWAIGFTYKITREPNPPVRIDYPDGYIGWTRELEKIYIGKKMLTSNRKKKVGKRALEKQFLETGDRRKGSRVIKITKPSKWEEYTGSCKELNDDIKSGKWQFRKEILGFSFSRKNLSFCECFHQMSHLQDIVNGRSYNGHVANWYMRDIVKPKTEEK